MHANVGAHVRNLKDLLLDGEITSNKLCAGLRNKAPSTFAAPVPDTRIPKPRSASSRPRNTFMFEPRPALRQVGTMYRSHSNFREIQNWFRRPPASQSVEDKLSEKISRMRGIKLLNNPVSWTTKKCFACDPEMRSKKDVALQHHLRRTMENFTVLH